jgi:hypothetical protein
LKAKEIAGCRRVVDLLLTIANSNVSQEDETEVAAAVTMLRSILCASKKKGLSGGIPVARQKVTSLSLAHSQSSSLT